MKNYLIAALLGAAVALASLGAHAQAHLETDGQTPMPAAEWRDQATGHKVQRIKSLDGTNGSFYFHDDPFLKTAAGQNEMVFYHTDEPGQQLRLLNPQTQQVRPLTGYYKRSRWQVGDFQG